MISKVGCLAPLPSLQRSCTAALSWSVRCNWETPPTSHRAAQGLALAGKMKQPCAGRDRLMTSLPIDQSLPEILTSLREHRRLVLVAPPGAGKTTRVPPALVRSGLLSQEHPGVIVLQPRRVAARATAARIADEQNWSLGEEVGYQIRFERRISATTRLRIQTEGILNRQLLADPFLETIGAVVLDEFHERSLHSDLALALLREIRRDVRPDLIIVVMSATLDAQPVAQFLDDCPVVRVEGRTFPIDLSYHASVRPASPEAIEPLVREVLANRSAAGHVLVFLPGMAEIRRVQKAIEPLAAGYGALVLPLHGSLSAEDQDRAVPRSADEDHPGDKYRRDVADHRRRHDRDRQRPCPDRPPRPPARFRSPRPGPHQPGGGDAAGGPRRADQPRAVLAVMVRARAADAATVRDCRGAPRRPFRGRSGSSFLGCSGCW